jgi:hypothetical protein
MRSWSWLVSTAFGAAIIGGFITMKKLMIGGMFLSLMIEASFSMGCRSSNPMHILKQSP